MKENYLQVVAAVLLGLVLPGLVIQIATPITEPSAQEMSSSPTSVESAPSQVGIWVQTESGATQWMILEEYLAGVILAEMPTSYDHEALCAQAVVARTYALKRQKEARHPQNAVCTDPGCCQAYVEVAEYLDGLGYEEDVSIAVRATAATEGMVLTYEGAIIEATYFHCSGGRTEDAVAVWGVDYPYLKAVDSPGEEKMEHYSDRIFYPREELEEHLGRALPGTPGSWLGWITYTTGGGVESILFAGVQYSGVQIRRLLGLNSTAFSVEAGDDGLWFTTQGKGHRVGMSQSGAQAMALDGHSWQDILAHYYPGTRIDKLQDVG